MDKNDIIEYVMNTPHNTNKAVLSGMLNQLTEGSGGGSSDFSTAKVTVAASGLQAYIGLPVAMLGEDGYAQALEVAESGVYTVILCEGKCTVFAESYVDGKMAVVSVTGNAEAMGDSVFTITGDCAVTLTLQDAE